MILVINNPRTPKLIEASKIDPTQNEQNANINNFPCNRTVELSDFNEVIPNKIPPMRKVTIVKIK